MTPTPGKTPLGTWGYTAVALVLLAALIRGGGAAALMPLMRLIVPIVVLIVILRLIKGQVRIVFGNAPRPRAASRRADEGEIIDLCPKCGAYLRPGHRCQAPKA